MLEKLMPKEVTCAPADDKKADGSRFDYNAEAELFPGRNLKTKSRSAGYRRFVYAADAIRFAIEQLTPEFLYGAYLEVEEARFDAKAIRRLYDSTDYPLARGSLAR
jgi:hypothetical protein